MGVRIIYPAKSGQMGKIQVRTSNELVLTLRSLVRDGKSPIQIEFGSKCLTISQEIQDELFEEFVNQPEVLRELGIKELA
jgi:hypothetical protein